MKNIVLISRCLSIANNVDKTYEYVFHFNGYYMGEKLVKVIIISQIDLFLEKHEDYLLYVRLLRIENGRVYGKILKKKVLSTCSI